MIYGSIEACRNFFKTFFLNVDALCVYTHNKTHYVTSLQRSCEKSSVFTDCQPVVFMQLPDAKLAVRGNDFLPRLFYISVHTTILQEKH